MKCYPWSTVTVAAFAALIGAGCALTSKAEALDVHHYAPEVPAPREAAAPSPVPGEGGAVRTKLMLRLGRISAGSHLGKKLVYRTSSVGVGIYDDRRWTERPDEYLRRSLSGTLFGERGLTQILTGVAATLDVELVAFDEIRSGAQRHGRVEIRYALHDEQEVLLSDSVAIEIVAASERPEDLVRAISIALARATAKIADRVTSRLAEDARETPAE